jgi:hypothetical protein
MRIRELTPDTHQAYQSFLLTGLVEDEENFRISPDDEKAGPFPTSDREDSFTPGALGHYQPAGVVSFGREGKGRQKLRHKGLLFRHTFTRTSGEKARPGN